MNYDVEVDCGLDGTHRLICGKCKKLLFELEKMTEAEVREFEHLKEHSF
jgi:hypothetical protein